MSELNPIPEYIPRTKLKPFYLFMKGNFPFIEDTFEALDYYSLICKLGEKINEIIEANNNEDDNVKNLYDAFVNLYNYVSNYFDDLDVQENIDNKLDEMAESGELTELIAQFLQTKAIFCFDTVSDLINADNLANGSIVKTLGFYSIDDLGGSYYKIRTLTVSDVIDNSTIIELNNYETLIAELILNDTMNVCQFGVKDNVESTNKFQIAVNSMEGKKLIIPNITLILNNTITLSDNISIENRGKIEYSADLIYLFQNLSQDCNINLNGLDIEKIDNSFENLNRFIYIAFGSLIIENSKFKNCGTAIHCEGKKLIANNITLNNVYGTLPQYGYGVNTSAIENVIENIFVKNDSSTQGRHVVYLNGTQMYKTTISNVNVENWYHNPIAINVHGSSTADIIIENCKFINCLKAPTGTEIAGIIYIHAEDNTRLFVNNCVARNIIFRFLTSMSTNTKVRISNCYLRHDLSDTTVNTDNCSIYLRYGNQHEIYNIYVDNTNDTHFKWAVYVRDISQCFIDNLIMRGNNAQYLVYSKDANVYLGKYYTTIANVRYGTVTPYPTYSA